MIRIPGSHPANIKNRSSKHLIPLTKYKPYVRSMNNEELAKYTSEDAARERKRRKAKNDKKNGVTAQM